jgi:ABC-type multidrug transport system fused ATPase/permease subunit
VTLTVGAGELVAVTGPVGCGKSALAALVAGLYPVVRGEVTVDGRDPYRSRAEDRGALGYLPQGHPVFSGTVRDNVRLGEIGGDERFNAAATIAGLTDDLTGWPDREDTQIGELGVRVSGGQRQRIALARAIAAPHESPGLLVLDDPFSAVDIATESAIVGALREYAGNRATILLCSTRLAAFPLADRIVVLDAGRIVEQGSHEQLLAQQGLYARIFRAQQRAHQLPSQR